MLPKAEESAAIDQVTSREAYARKDTEDNG